MKAWISGGAGFIGSHLARHLLVQGASVTVLDDLSAGSIHAMRDLFGHGPQFRFVRGSVLDADLVARTIGDADAIFHLAAQVHVEESIADPASAYRTNAIGTLHVLEAAREHRTPHVVYASSTEVYGDGSAPLDEDAPLRPRSPYAAGKAAADALCGAYGATYELPIVRLRQFNTIGEGQRPKGYAAVVPIFAERLWQGRPPVIFGDGTQSRDFHYIGDLLRAYDLVIEQWNMLVREPVPVGSAPVLNLGTGVPTTIRALAETMIAIAADEWQDASLRDLRPIHAAPRPGEVAGLLADAQRAKDALGFTAAVPIEEALRRYLRWFAREFG